MPPADTSQHCSDPERGIRIRLRVSAEWTRLVKTREKDVLINPLKVRFWLARGGVGEAQWRGVMDKQKKGRPVTCTVRPEPGKGLGGAHGFPFMTNVHIWEFWGLSLGTLIKQKCQLRRLRDDIGSRDMGMG